MVLQRWRGPGDVLVNREGIFGEKLHLLISSISSLVTQPLSGIRKEPSSPLTKPLSKNSAVVPSRNIVKLIWLLGVENPKDLGKHPVSEGGLSKSVAAAKISGVQDGASYVDRRPRPRYGTRFISVGPYMDSMATGEVDQSLG